MTILLTTSELLGCLDASRSTIYRFIKDLGLPHIRLGHIIRYDKAALNEWMAQQTLRANAKAAALKNEHQDSDITTRVGQRLSIWISAPRRPCSCIELISMVKEPARKPTLLPSPYV